VRCPAYLGRGDVEIGAFHFVPLLDALDFPPKVAGMKAVALDTAPSNSAPTKFSYFINRACWYVFTGITGGNRHLR
jgi:hypothetical protein